MTWTSAAYDQTFGIRLIGDQRASSQSTVEELKFLSKLASECLFVFWCVSIGNDLRHIHGSILMKCEDGFCDFLEQSKHH